MEYYSAMKKNENLSLTGKWMELKNIILSEVSQIQKDKDNIFSLIICKIDPNTKISIIIYTYICKTFPKMGLLTGRKKRMIE
jgi:hypothetical protein